MPSRTLPTFTRAEVESHNTSKSCYVSVGKNVYDVTDFLEAHPGGAELILDYAGQDVESILQDADSHIHTEAAYEVLEDSLVGFVLVQKPANGTNGKAVNGAANNRKANGNGAAKTSDADEAVEYDAQGRPIHPLTGMSCVEDLNKETDIGSDYKKHKFLDLNKPLLKQVWFGGFSKKFYLEQVHRPRHYKGGESAPLFGNFLEPLSKTPWFVIPMVWLPPVTYGTYLASQGFENPASLVACWLGGVALWTFIEYILHRFLFHIDEYLPDNRVGITLHFLLHGVHHYLPMDKYRLVMPPALFFMLASPFWKLAHTIFFFDWYVGTAVYCGGIFGYICYDLTHYFLHFRHLPPFYKELKKHHLEHHFLDYQNGFGVSNKFWDKVFGTEIVPLVKTK